MTTLAAGAVLTLRRARTAVSSGFSACIWRASLKSFSRPAMSSWEARKAGQRMAAAMKRRPDLSMKPPQKGSPDRFNGTLSVHDGQPNSADEFGGLDTGTGGILDPCFMVG